MKHEHRHAVKVACPGRVFKPVGQAATFWLESSDSFQLTGKVRDSRLTQTHPMPSLRSMSVHTNHSRFLLLNRPLPRAVQARAY